jgi:Ca2+-binding RTX toxin-like protein
MTGGAGNDSYVVVDAGDVVVEAADGGYDMVDASVDYTMGDNVEMLNLIGTAMIDGTGNSLANTIVGGAGHNVIDGMGGNDVLNGGNGDDVLSGGDGDDKLFGGAGQDFLWGDAGNDIIGYVRASDIQGDRVCGFHTGDRIDLSKLDADTTSGATNEAFSFIGGAAFSGKAGELRAVAGGYNGALIVTGDLNGDAVADFTFEVAKGGELFASDFML